MKTKKLLIIIVLMLVSVSASNFVYGQQLSIKQTLIKNEPMSPMPLGDITIVYSFDSPGQNPHGLAWDGTYLWNTDLEGEIYKIDPTNGNVISSFDGPSFWSNGLEWDGNYLWNSDGVLEKIYKIDPSNGNILSSFDSPDIFPFGLAWDGTYLWHADEHITKIYKIDPTNGNILSSFDSPDCLPQGLAWDGTCLWNADTGLGRIYKINAINGSVISIFSSPGPAPTGLAWDGTYLWHADSWTNKIYKIDITDSPPPPPQDNPPVAKYTWTDADGTGSETVINFDASSSTDDHGITLYEWDWTNDGTYDATGKMKSHDYGNTNSYNCKLRVTDTIGQTNTITKTVQANVPSTVLLTEGFEEGTMPPTGWTVTNGNAYHPWIIIEADEHPELVHSGDYSAFITWDDQHQSDNKLSSPNIDLSDCPKITLTFWAGFSTKYPDATVELHVKGSGFDDIIWDMIQDENKPSWGYVEKTFDLTSYKDKVIKLEWRYVGIDGNSFALDDITVVDPPGGGGVSQQQQQISLIGMSVVPMVQKTEKSIIKNTEKTNTMAIEQNIITEINVTKVSEDIIITKDGPQPLVTYHVKFTQYYGPILIRLMWTRASGYISFSGYSCTGITETSNYGTTTLGWLCGMRKHHFIHEKNGIGTNRASLYAHGYCYDKFHPEDGVIWSWVEIVVKSDGRYTFSSSYGQN